MKKIFLVFLILILIPTIVIAASSRDFNVSGYLTTSAAPYATTNHDWTVAAWVHPDNFSADRVFISDRYGGSYGYKFLLGQSSGSKAKCLAYTGSGSEFTELLSTTSQSANAWNFITCRQDDGGSNIELFLNGVSEASSATTRNYTTANPVTLGRWSGPSPGQDYDGEISQANFYKEWLTTALIQELMWCPERMGSPNRVRFYPIWGSDSPENDLAGSGSTAALTNTAAAVSNGPPIFYGSGLPL